MTKQCPLCPYYLQKTSYGTELVKCGNKECLHRKESEGDMTVDETIQHCEDIAKILWCEGKEESAEEHLILAAWLRDYKRMQEPMTGHWVLDGSDNSLECTNCGCVIYANDIMRGEPHYCPNCGAKMEADQ